MSMTSAYGPAADKGEMIKLIRSAHETGLTLFDTAEAYGPFANEVLVGEAAVIVAYTAHADRVAQEPPTFAIVGEADGIAPRTTMERRVAACATREHLSSSTPTGLGHGFGLGTGTAAAGWTAHALRFWAAHTPGRDEAAR